MRKTCLDEVYNLAKKDNRVVFVGSDLGAGVLSKFKEEMPERFFMEGISEQHIVGMSAGLAMCGFIPYVNTIATFITRRCFEQIVIDIGLHNLPVRLIGSGGGLVYAPLGPTHLAIDDIAIMRTVPNMTIVAVSDAVEMKKFMIESVYYKGPIYIRLAKGSDEIVTSSERIFKIGKSFLVEEGKDLLLISTGISLQIALKAKQLLIKKRIDPAILHIPTVKPIDAKAIIKFSEIFKTIITIEEGLVSGGLGTAVGEILQEKNYKGIFRKIGIPNVFPDKYGSQNDLLKYYKITPGDIYRYVTA